MGQFCTPWALNMYGSLGRSSLPVCIASMFLLSVNFIELGWVAILMFFVGADDRARWSAATESKIPLFGATSEIRLLSSNWSTVHRVELSHSWCNKLLVMTVLSSSSIYLGIS